jgi:hypothetical protein
MERRRTSEWLSLAGEWVRTVVIWTIVLIILVLIPAWAVVGVAQWTFRQGNLALEIAVVTILMLMTGFFVWLAFTEQRLPSAPWAERARAFLSRTFGPRLSEGLSINRSGPTIRTLMVALFAVASFASLTSLLYLEGAITISEPVSQEDAIFEAAAVYVWHLLDTVPLLDIPQNLEWEVPFEFEDSLGGLLVILFTAIVILPLIQVVRAIWTGHREPYEVALRSALGNRLPAWKTTKLLGVGGGYERVLVEGSERILVDVMHGVSTEDAPLRRLEVVRTRLAPYYDTGGYLLVVDAVAERARDRIEEAFRESTLPSLLVVWRGDEPGSPLADAIECLAKRIASAREA